MPDTPSPSSLTVLGGPLNGSRLLLDQVADEILIGSDPDCSLHLDLPAVSPIHARIWFEEGGYTIHDTRSPSGVYVNDNRVVDQAPLRDGDILWLGPPGEEGSVMIQCRIAPPAAEEAMGGGEELFGETPPAAEAAAGEPGPAIDDVFEEPPAPAAEAAADAPADEFAVMPAEEAPSDAAPAVEDFVAEEPATTAASAEETPLAPADEFLVAPAEELAAEPTPAVEEFVVEEPAAVPSAETPPAFEAEPPPAFEIEAPSTPEAEAAPAASDAAPVVEEAFFAETPEAVPDAAFTEPGPMALETEAAPAPAFAEAPPEDLFVVEEPPAEPAAPPPAPAAPPPAPEPPRAPAAPPAAAAPPVRPAPAAAPRPKPPRPEPKKAEAAPPRPPAKKTPVALYAGVGLAALVVLGGGGFVAMRALSAPKLASVSPIRAHAGQPVTLSGSRFAPDAAGNVVLFGDKPARVQKASDSQLQAEVPEIQTVPGRDTRVSVSVRVGDRVAGPVEINVYQAPRISGLSPDVAMPGETVVLAGTGWGPGAKVRFGALEAEVVDVAPTALKVRVPAIEGGPGAASSVVVSMGPDASNTAPFLVGHLPLVTGATPATAAPGDVLTLTGRGFGLKPADNAVKIGGVVALVTSAGSELKAVVPRLPAAEGDVAVEVRVRGLDNVGQATLKLTPPTDPAEFRFVAEPYQDAEGHDHALLSTELGPAFVLSASGGKTAAERALEAENRLNAAAVPLKAAREADIEARTTGAAPSLGLVGKPEPLVEATEEDAAAYNEDWTKLGGKGGPVTRGRLAAWWGAVARDLVLLLVRSEKPHFAADLAPEGRVLGDVFQAARKKTNFGLPRSVVAEAKPPTREALRVLGLRVPAAVAEPAGAEGAAAQAALHLEGPWSGSESSGGLRKDITVTFKGNGGTFAFEGGVTLSMPLLSAEQPQKGSVRFSIKFRGGPRYYVGRWDGQKISGTISADPSGKGDLGTFELLPRH